MANLIYTLIAIYIEADYKILYNRYHNYKILCKRERSRCRILQIINQHDENVTDIIKPYMGPAFNFHGIPTSPSDLGYKRLSFEMLGGEWKVYEENDLIVI